MTGAVLVLVPTLIFAHGKMIVTNFNVWAPEPITICTAFQHKRTLWFRCESETGKPVRFTVSGVYKA